MQKEDFLAISISVLGSSRSETGMLCLDLDTNLSAVLGAALKVAISACACAIFPVDFSSC
jgi:hypothetical protein